MLIERTEKETEKQNLANSVPENPEVVNQQSEN
jgi:hypothetical protein